LVNDAIRESLAEDAEDIAAFEDRTKDPRPPGHEKLTGQEKYRIRQDTYRIIYFIQEQELTLGVVRAGPRGRGVSEWSISYRASSCASRAKDVGSPPFRHQILEEMGKRKRTTHLVE
jgi:mRNA-degrading endonuclease RelE of RelBE toxin-antitoxin system